MANMTGGRALVESLKAQDVNTVFGVISIHNLNIFDALYDAQDTIRFVGGRLELACGYMADGYSRASGRPGVLVTSAGPGAADSLGAMGEAYHSGSAVLEITTNVEKDFINSGMGMTHEPINQLEMFRSVTDWNALVTDIESIPDYIQEAFQRFQSRRPRPIELEVPTDMLGEEADVEIGAAVGAPLPTGDPTMIEKAVELLSKAKRPVIFVGDEVNYCGGTEELITLAEAMGAPVVSIDGSKGGFPDDHPLALGQTLIGFVWGLPHLRDFIASCDAALVVGSTLPYKTTRRLELQMPEALVHVCLDGDAIGRIYPSTVPIVANPKEALSQILSLLKGRDVHKGDSYQQEVVSLKAGIREAMQERTPAQIYTYDAMRSALPRDTVTCWDATVVTYRGGGVCAFPAYEPRSFMHTHGWAGLGFGFPASLGAKLARPDVPVVCITGDGGFQYNMQELATAAQYGINPIVVMFNDNAWGALKGAQLNRYDGRLIGTELVNPDFVSLFNAYGFEGTRVTSVDELVNAIGSAMGSDRLQLIEAQMPNGFANFK